MSSLRKNEIEMINSVITVKAVSCGQLDWKIEAQNSPSSLVRSYVVHAMYINITSHRFTGARRIYIRVEKSLNPEILFIAWEKFYLLR